MLILSLILATMIVFYPNTLFFSFSLLGVVFTLLFFLTSSGLLRVLTSLMLLIVYVGAMIILIGYICAVSPNVVTLSEYSALSVVLVPTRVCLVAYLLFPHIFTLPCRGPTFSSVSYLYTSSGFFSLSLVALALFLVLLIVTSQYLSPKGPFRSL